MKLKRRALSLLVALAVTFAFMPTLALAEEITDEEGSRVQEETVVETNAEQEAVSAEESVQPETEAESSKTSEGAKQEKINKAAIEEAAKEKTLQLQASGDDYGSINLEYGEDSSLYTDGTLTLYINDEDFDAEDYEYNVSLSYNGYAEEDEDSIEGNIEGTDCFSIDGNEIVLNGAEIWKELKNLGDYSFFLTVEVAAIKDGEVLASDYAFPMVVEPYVDEWEDLPEESEEIVGSYYEINKNFSVYYYSGTIEDSSHEKEIISEIVAVKVDGRSISLDKEKGLWRFPVKSGANDVTLTYKLFDINSGQLSEETEDYEFTITGVSDIYRVYTEVESKVPFNYGDETVNPIIPGETVTFVAEGEHLSLGSDGNEKKDYDFDYKWKIEQGKNQVDIVKVETAPSNKWSRVTVKAKDSIDPMFFDENDEIKVRVAANLVSKKDPNYIVANSGDDFSITMGYSEIVLSSAIPGNMEVGRSLTVKPTTFDHWVLWNDFKDVGQSYVTEFEEVGYCWVFDEDVVTIKNNGSPIYSDDDGEGDVYYGSFTITRKKNETTSLVLTSYSYNDEEEIWEEVASVTVNLFKTDPITNVDVSGIVDRQYNGKAQEQDIVVREKDEEDDTWYDLYEGIDYTVTYKNNVNAGTASVIIDGCNYYTGQIIKTFKISKIKQAPVVSVSTKKVKAKAVKKKKQKVQPLTVSGAQGAVSYKGVGANKKSKKALKINSKTGQITVKKGTKKGTYKMKVTVNVAGNGNYDPYTVVKTVSIKVK